jgi:Skp family chaperone for outer membrane proteins
MFPFLAVLLCTIGALVLILVISVVHSRATAERFMESQVTQRLEQAKESSDIMESVSDELQARREKVKQEIERRRRELANIEDHIARMNQEMEQLRKKAEAIDAAADLDETEQQNTDQRLAEVREEIEKKKRELAEEIEKQKKRKPAFAILPYKGPNGTSRRPVYLECRKEGVIIQPEGVLISFTDLRPPHGPGNPLDAALRVLRTTYQEKDATFGLTTPPYPLLIVRPDGIHTYALARAAMSGWDDQFGYELIDEEMELAFPPGAPQLANDLKTALDMAKRRQEALLASLPRQYVRSREMVNNEDGDSLFGDASNSRTGSSGSNDWGDEPGTDRSGVTISEDNNRWKMVQELQQGQVVAEGDTGPGGDTGAGGRSGRGAATPRSNNPLGGTTLQNSAPALSSGIASSGTLGSANLSGSYETVQGQSPTALQSLPGRGASAGTAAGAQGSPGSNAGGSSASVSGTVGSGTAGSGTAGSGTAGSYGSPNGSPSNANNRANAFSSGTANGMSSTSLDSGSSTASSDPNQVQGSIQDTKYQDSKMAESMPQPQVNMSVQSPSASKDTSTSSPQNSPDYKNSAVARKNAARTDSDSKPISITAGKGWATSRAEGKASPVSRPIRIVALSDRWLLRSESNETKIDTEVMLETGPQQASRDLEQAIRERVDSWGPSLPGGYWSPTVTIESASDADLSVQRMQRLLDGSGVDIRVVPLQAPPQKKSR